MAAAISFNCCAWAQASSSGSPIAPQPASATLPTLGAEKFSTGLGRTSMRVTRRALLIAVTDHDTLLQYARDFARRGSRADASSLLQLLVRPYMTGGLQNIIDSDSAKLDLSTRDLIIELQLARAELMLLLGDSIAATSLLDTLTAKHAPDYEITFSRDGRKFTLSDQIERLRSLSPSTTNTKGGSLDVR